MKRFLLATLAIAGLTICGFAQTKTTTRVKKAKVENSSSSKTASTTKMAPNNSGTVTTKTTTSTVPARPAVTTSKTTTSVSGPTKKDGTPDMRYKVNKESAKPVKLKKDGTPDMRYKANKKN